jgi:hypothetical protein
MDNATKALESAIPLIKEAEEAVNCLNKAAIDELKSFGAPSPAVLLTVKAVLILYKNERRNNYVTPTSFLELIKFYKKLLNDKRGKIIDQIKRLEIGLQTMDDTNKVVADLSVELDETMKIVD